MFCALLTAALRSPLPAGLRAMSFYFGTERGRYPIVLLAPRTQSRGSSRAPAAERSGVAPRVFAGIGPGALSGGCTRPLVMLVVGRDREAAAPSRVYHEESVEPSSSV